jgi:serine protease Do
MSKSGALLLSLAILTGTTMTSVGAEEPSALEKQMTIIAAVQDGLVTVEYTLQYDQGMPPEGTKARYMCPNCSRMHTRNRGKTLIDQQRPLKETAFLLDKTTLVTADIGLEPRFIKQIRVTAGKEYVTAEIKGYAMGRDAAFLKLAKPLKGAKPLTFNAKAEGPYLTVARADVNGESAVNLAPLPASLYVDRAGKAVAQLEGPKLIVTSNGVPVAVAMGEELPADGSWKGSPAGWDQLSTKKHADKLDALKALADNSLVRVCMKLRSPKAKSDDAFGFSRRFMSARSGQLDASATEVNAVGVATGKKRLLVLAQMSDDITARIEKITVIGPDGDSSEGTFAGTLKEYGALLVDMKKPLVSPIALSEVPLQELKHRLLLSATIKVSGEERTAHLWHGRISACARGQKQKLYPVLSGSMVNTFYFTPDMKLAVLPVVPKKPVSVRASDRYRSDSPIPVPSGHIRPLLAARASDLDPNNVPLSEERAERIAWLGVDLQKMDKDLARANKCSEQTNNGESGALVSFVYPNGPAAKAGITVGMVLLRITLEAEPKPINVKLDRDQSGPPMQWSQLDQMPAEYLSRMPAPWPAVNTSFNRLLTSCGIGTKYTAEFFSKGEILKKDLTVSNSPTHYDSAPKHKCAVLGITVRDLTFEVRRYLQKGEDDPGIVISKAEAGSKAAVAGIKPFELITHIDGEPVTDVKAYAKFIETKKELSLTITRMAATRQVRLTLE